MNPGGTINEAGFIPDSLGTLVLGTTYYNLIPSQGSLIGTPTILLNGTQSTFQSTGAVATVNAFGDEYVGYSPNGVRAASGYMLNYDLPTNVSFTQNGSFNSLIPSSVHTVSGILYLGYGQGAVGNYTLNGGLLSTAGEVIGSAYGTGNFIQNGTNSSSVNQIIGNLVLGYGIANFTPQSGFTTNGSYTLNGGTLSVVSNASQNGAEFVGLAQGSAGSAQFTQTGGSNSSKYLVIGNGSNGTYTQVGGVNTTSELDLVNLGGAPLIAGALPSVGTSGAATYNLGQYGPGQGTACAGCGGQLNVTGAMNVYGYTANFQQSAGQTSVGTLNAAVGGTVYVSGTTPAGCPGNQSLCNFYASNSININPSSTLIIAGGATVASPTVNAKYGNVILNNGTLDPAVMNFTGGTVSGHGNLVGNVTANGTSFNVGGTAPGTLHISGNYAQTGGSVNFIIGSNGQGGFTNSSLLFDPGNSVSINGSKIVFDFSGGAGTAAVPFNVNTFFQSSNGNSFASSFGLHSLSGDTFIYQTNGGKLYDVAFNPLTGGLTATNTAAVPEPSIVLCEIVGLGMLCAVIRRRKVENSTTVIWTIPQGPNRASHPGAEHGA